MIQNWKTLSHIPVNKVNDRTEISPEGIIQLALSDFRRREEYSDDELAQYIAELLAFIMADNNLIIFAKDVKDIDGRFKILHFGETK